MKKTETTTLAEENKISLVAPTGTDIYKIRFQGEDVEIKYSLSFEEMLGMVHEVVNGSFDDDGNYQPELTDFYFKKEIIEDYTNIILPINPIEIYSLVYNTTLCDDIIRNVNQEQITEIKRAFERKIGSQVRTNERNYTRTIETLTETFENIGKKFENMFSKTNPNDVARVFDVIDSIGINEDKIVQTYIKEAKA